jgi:RNA polymerase sigma-70 factor, ECF subfamily
MQRAAPSGELAGSDVSALLRAWSGGDQGALKRLTPIVYDELHRLARRCMKGERPGHSLQATALVNEAYTRLVDYKRMQWQNRAHFLPVSAQLMRRILVDRARRHNLKRGAGFEHVSLEAAAVPGGDRDTDPSLDLVGLDDALNALARIDPRKAQIVEMRFFGGLSAEETAEVLKISAVTSRASVPGRARSGPLSNRVSPSATAPPLSIVTNWQAEGAVKELQRAGDCCSDPRSSPFPVSAPCWWQDLWLLGSWGRSKEPRWLAE